MSEQKPVKFKLRVNIFDVIIIVAAIAAGFLLLRLSNADGGGGTALNPGTAVTARYTLELGNLPVGMPELIKPGDKLTDVILKRAIGSVVSVTSSPYYMTSRDLYTGDMILTAVPEREAAYIIVEIAAIDSGSEVAAGGFPVRAGTQLTVSGPGYSGVGMIVDVER
ncbi:MAG: DUF4330 domain-containing protein [Oscillospiraceae bacterium]|jgi:hypothetical protein|nr:DUF4330 domain-containing protein [Oscillospiraceae bacterium]